MRLRINGKHFLIHLGATALGAVLFGFSFPNVLNANGFPLLAWIAFVPVFWVIQEVNLPVSAFWGALYGYGAYSIFNYWLSGFNPLAGIIVNSIYLVYFAVLFPILKLALILFPRRGYIVQWALWIGYEYLRTLGFLGYSYGIIGYSQWRLIPIIQIASIFGVWGVSALVMFPSCYLGAGMKSFLTGEGSKFFKREWLPGGLWVLALAGTLVYGFVGQVNTTGARSVNLALIQHNDDPWKGDLPQYRQNYYILKRLSQEAVSAKPKPDLVVWSETAFVPRIYWHMTYRDDPDYAVLVEELIN
jgi:apolipoprotein N-acyltransferase